MHNDDIELEPLVGPSRIHDRAGVETQAPAQGHYYSHNQVRDHARVHFGDVYNYRDTDSSERNVLDWLTSLNPSESHSQACQKYQEGTLAWFFADIRFEDWSDGLEGLTPRTLWCRGTIGAGKTVLTGQILSHTSRKDMQRLSCRGILSLP